MTTKKKPAVKAKKTSKKLVLGNVGGNWMETANISLEKLSNAFTDGQNQGYKLGFAAGRANHYHWGYIALATVLGLLAGVCL